MNFRDYPELLRTVEKPGRYTGGELYEIRKDPAPRIVLLLGAGDISELAALFRTR